MGISGLLPALKAIQKTKHLSDFDGKTVAVDAYAWLHRGIHACATELATDKPTTKYVTYIMDRVRILRHHGVEPYIVFDGGALPAKKETEISRRTKREDSLARGRALHAQGKHSQAREFFTKCVDVTPQMAYQCIKALIAENVKYVVAPYEADAQMAYLERMGLVDAIVTEDSDLLVFGCKNVLYKLDIVARTVISISRCDFSAVHSDGIILTNWSDKQFRAMAILSGCDYISSIPGVGLKTANTLLRKWKTVEQVVRAIAFEGKKSIPPGYLEAFKVAEKCFLYQRVYDPKLERLVHLTGREDDEWDATLDAHVGGHIDAPLAKLVASGEVDPITFLPMEDINPSYDPKSLPKSLKFVKDEKGKSKSQTAGQSSPIGILSFFGPNATIPQMPKSPHVTPITIEKRMIVGKASGKRTLADAMDEGVRKKRPRASAPAQLTVSKFFATSQSNSLPSTPVASSSRLRDEKENIPVELVKDLDSLVAQGEVDEQMDLNVEEQDPIVDQEDGYISPSPSQSHDTDDLSSPVRPPRGRSRSMDDVDFGADVVSSPVVPTPKRPCSFKTEHNLIAETPDALDLRRMLCVEDIDSSDEEAPSPSAPPPSLTPPDACQDYGESDQVDDDEEDLAREQEARQAAVAEGWRKRFAFPLQRSNTNVTPAGRHRAAKSGSGHRAHPYTPISAPASAPTGSGRKSLVFVDTLKKSAGRPRLSVPSGDSTDEDARARLARFRCR